MSRPQHAQTLVLGSGPAGCTAAVYAARAMLKPLLVRGIQPGGQLTITTDVENYPGFAETIQGPWLMEQMEAQAAAAGAALVNDIVTGADLASRPFRLTGDSGSAYTADTLIICTGAQARWLGLPEEEHFKGHGLSACATCDGFFYRGKSVLVVGGGNTAVEEALFLTNFTDRVRLIHRRDSLRAEKVLQERLFAHPGIAVTWDTTVEEFLGGGTPPGITGARLRHVKSGAVTEAAADGIFIAIGHTPATEPFRGQVAMREGGYIITAPDSTATDVPGVFAAGDVTDDVYRQAVTAAGLGCMAALEAEKFLAAARTP